jgi:aspartyl-tRNA synthetase
MLTSIENPIVEAWKVRLDSGSKISKKFVTGFMDSAEAAEFRNNPDGAPGVFIFDPRKPLEGLHAFGFEAAEQLQALYADAAASPQATDSQFEEGDVLFIQARENAPHTGGSTMLGRLRLAFFNAARAEGQVTGDLRDQFLWVTDFPMFTLNDGDGPGQEGHSGFSATHHPFTAPKSAADVDLLLTDPLSAIADHYDLVLNGVELGGGSRRIHSAEMQQFIMRDILKVCSLLHMYDVLLMISRWNLNAWIPFLTSSKLFGQAALLMPASR